MNGPYRETAKRTPKRVTLWQHFVTEKCHAPVCDGRVSRFEFSVYHLCLDCYTLAADAAVEDGPSATDEEIERVGRELFGGKCFRRLHPKLVSSNSERAWAPSRVEQEDFAAGLEEGDEDDG